MQGPGACKLQVTLLLRGRTNPRCMKSGWFNVLCLTTSPFAIASGLAGDFTVHSSGRYFQEASGKPLFFIGYYGWAAVPDGYFIDHPSRYASIMQGEAAYHVNYVRISLGVNRFLPGGHPPSHDGITPVPFRSVNTGGVSKADLDQWDTLFSAGFNTL